MKLNKNEISRIIEDCRLIVEGAYRGKIESDEYFHRGFLLATTEISKLMIQALEKYDVTTRGENNDKK